MRAFLGLFRGFDIWLFSCALLLSLLGLITMYSYHEHNVYFNHQILWIVLSSIFLLIASIPDYRFLRTSNSIFYAYVVILTALVAVLIIGRTVKGAQSRFNFGFFALQPADPAKLVLIMVLAKYFTKRHVEVANIKHMLISGVYAFLIFGLVAIQPDFGSAVILFFVWFGMVLVSGIPIRYVALVFFIGAFAFSGLWAFGFKEYQKDRIRNFLHPLADIQGTGYNAYQSTIAVGSGQLWGKGIGYGTQSKLQFLPEYETDFIFAAYAEEWGYVGVLLVFALFTVFVWRALLRAYDGETNFERLFGAGLAILITAHFSVHIGMNIGLLPVTGLTVPFLSYGGSHLMVEYIGIGMLIGMTKRKARVALESEETLILTA